MQSVALCFNPALLLLYEINDLLCTDCVYWPVGYHRASELHRRRRAVSSHAEGPVLSHRREESVLAGHHATDPRRALQQPRDHSDVSLAQSHHRAAASVCAVARRAGPSTHHRAAAPDRVPVRRLRDETELRLAEEVKVRSQRGQGHD